MHGGLCFRHGAASPPSWLSHPFHASVDPLRPSGLIYLLLCSARSRRTLLKSLSCPRGASWHQIPGLPPTILAVPLPCLGAAWARLMVCAHPIPAGWWCTFDFCGCWLCQFALFGLGLCRHIQFLDSEDLRLFGSQSSISMSLILVTLWCRPGSVPGPFVQPQPCVLFIRPPRPCVRQPTCVCNLLGPGGSWLPCSSVSL